MGSRWYYPESFLRSLQEKLKIIQDLCLGRLLSHMQPLRIMLYYPEFSVCLKAALELRWRALRGIAAPLHWKGAVEVIRTSNHDASLEPFIGGGPGVDPELAGGTTYPIWPGDALESIRRSWKVWLARGTSGISYLAGYLRETSWMDGWINSGWQVTAVIQKVDSVQSFPPP